MRKTLIFLVAFLLVANPILATNAGTIGWLASRAGARAAQAATETALTDLKTEMDGAFRRYLDAVENDSPERDARFQAYQTLQNRYNQATDLLAQSKVLAPPPPPGGLSGLFSKVKERLAVFVRGDKHQMSGIEKLLWTIGRAIVPTLAVLAFTALCALPIGWMVVGSIAVAAATGAGVTYLAEKRANRFRPPGEKKSDSEIKRDTLISGITEGIMAPLNLLTAGFSAPLLRGASMKLIGQRALQLTAVQFAGRMTTSLAGGGVKKLWYDRVLHNDEKIARLEGEVGRMLAGKNRPGAAPLTREERMILAGLDTEITRLRSQDYTFEDIKKDVSRSAISSVIAGGLGSTLTSLGAESNAAARLSMKMFGDTRHTTMVSNWLLSNPTAFLNGAANAQLEKHFLAGDIADVRKERDRHPAYSPIWTYYQDRVSVLEAQRQAISPLSAGKDALISNLATQSATVLVAAAKSNLLDQPRAKRAEIERRFRDADPKWQEAAEAKSRADDFAQTKPRPESFGSVAEYRSALASYFRQLRTLERDVATKETIASNAAGTSDAQAVRAEIAHQVEVDTTVARRLELARVIGDKAYLEAYLYKLRQDADPRYSNLPPAELEAVAKGMIQKEYADRAMTLAAETQKIVDDVKRYKAIHEDAEAGASDPSLWKVVALGQQKLTPKQLREIEYQGTSIAPSTLKAKFVASEVATLRAQGLSDVDIQSRTNAIYARADQLVGATYGDSWSDFLRAEVVARQVQRLPYSPDGTVKIDDQLGKLLTKELPKQFGASYVADVNNEIGRQVMPIIGGRFGTSSIQGSAYNAFVDSLFAETLRQGHTELIDAGVRQVQKRTGGD